jgi:hypothetical protein
MAPNSEKRTYSEAFPAEVDEKEFSDDEISEIVSKRRFIYSGDAKAQFKAGAALRKAKKLVDSQNLNRWTLAYNDALKNGKYPTLNGCNGPKNPNANPKTGCCQENCIKNAPKRPKNDSQSKKNLILKKVFGPKNGSTGGSKNGIVYVSPKNGFSPKKNGSESGKKQINAIFSLDDEAISDFGGFGFTISNTDELELEKSVENQLPVYCICKRPFHEDEGRDMVGCDVCQDWFHLDCVGIKTLEEVENIDYTCPKCAQFLF